VGQDVRDDSRVCRTPPGPRKDLNWHLRPRTIMAVGLSFILTTGLVYVWIPKPPPIIIPDRSPDPGIPHAAIAIDGDANFSDTALLEGWPGDGSPENPYIIDGLDISPHFSSVHCISISNTRVSFTISNCNLTRTTSFHMMAYVGSGIRLLNVSNGELVNNTCNNNRFGIWLHVSDSNTLANNTCTNSQRNGISLYESDSNTVANNNCNNNSYGIHLWESDSNTVENNTCTSNGADGIRLGESDSNTVANNTCNYNEIGIHLGNNSDSNTVANNTCNSNDYGIYLDDSDGNTVANNICNNNRIDIDPSFFWAINDPDYVTRFLLLMGLVVITLLGAGWRMFKISRVVLTGE
jgi:parallel beta-helix repeat protein